MGDDTSLPFLFGILGLTLLLSAFFSSAETGIMTVNRYRLKHRARLGDRSAQRILDLLAQPDRLLGVLLIGNCLVNTIAASVATLIGMALGGDPGIAIATGLLTFILLIFGEVGPKTFAASHPEKIAHPAAFLLRGLLVAISPLVSLVNSTANFIFRLDRVITQGKDALSSEELRSIVHESSHTLPKQRKGMLLGVLDLENIAVEDIMIPRNEVVGINIDEELEDIVRQLRSIQHTRLPVFKGELNQCIGVLHVRNATRFLQSDQLTKAEILQYVREPYYVPEGTSLTAQLLNFQKQKRRFGLVVDEYGDVQGAVTLEDILEEIVGDFTTSRSDNSKDMTRQKDGSVLVDGSATIREINRRLHWDLPTDGPRTLNGLILEHLEAIPEAALSMQIGRYQLEIMRTQDNTVKTALVRQT